MLHDPLRVKREEMIGFLLESIVCKEIELQDRDIVFTDKKGRRFYIRTVSKQADFPYEFEENPHNFDEDRRRLNAIRDEVASFIAGKNEEGLIPCFVLLRADTDFSQLMGRTEWLVNYGHFVKQELPSEGNDHPRFDKKVMDPLELVLQQFYRHNSVNGGKRRVVEGVAYFPELICFNPKKGFIEIEYFADVIDPSELKYEYCPSCHQPNGEGYNHQACKETAGYISYRQARDVARYHKSFMIQLVRRSLDSRCHTESEKGVGFREAVLDSPRLHLPREGMRIALVRR